MNASPAAAAPRAPVSPNLRHAFGGVWRLTVARLFTPGHLAAVAGTLVLLGLVAVATLRSRGGPDEYVAWTISFYFTFLVPVIAFINAGGAIRDDMKPAMIDYVLTRPVPRSAFVGFKYLAHVAGAQLEFLLAAGLLIGLGLAFGVAGIGPAVPALLAAQALLVLVFSALGFLAGVLTTRYVVVGLAYGAIVEVGVGQIPTQLSRLSMTHQVRVALESLVASPTGSTSPAGILGLSTALLVCSVGALALAAVIFQLQEFAGSAET